jgi:di/tricarboxylate transporter
MRHAFLGIFIVLLVVWALSWIVWHIASGLIHLLLIVAIVALIFHLLHGRR